MRPEAKSQDYESGIAAVGALEDPVRRELYVYVARRGQPVGRDEAATAVGIGRPLAAYHLDKLVELGLLSASYARPAGRRGPGAGRPAKIYARSGREFTVSVPQREYELAAKLLDRCPKIDVLANNAGGLVSKHTVTGDGHELSFQANHLAPFLLTALLRERLAASGARVINTSSVANRFGSVNLDGLDNTDGSYVAFRTYATTKLENILFTRELSKRAAGQGITASCFHPGPVASAFGRDSFVTGLIYRTPLKRIFTITPEQGAEPLVHLATLADPDSVNGAYYHRMTPNGSTNRQADDAALMAGLWDRSAAMVGVDGM